MCIRDSIYIIDGDFIGRGEAAPSERYGESSELLLSLLENGIQVPENYQSREHLWSCLKPQLRKIASLEAAVNMAIWDLSAQKQNIPLYKSFGFENITLPKTSYTISIGKLDELDSKLEESKKCSILKVKLGTPHNDKEIIRQIRFRTDNLIRIDANEGWDYETAKKMVFWLADQNIVRLAGNAIAGVDQGDLDLLTGLYSEFLHIVEELNLVGSNRDFEVLSHHGEEG